MDMETKFNPETFSEDAITIKKFETILLNGDIEQAEMRINDFLAIVTSVEKAFILFTNDKRGSLSFCICGDQVFISPITHTLDIDPVNRAIYEYKPFYNINLDHPIVAQLSAQINVKIQSFLCVPLKLNFAENRSEALVCLANRKSFIKINEPSTANMYRTYRENYFDHKDVYFIKDLLENDVFGVTSGTDWIPIRRDIILYLGRVLLSKMQQPDYMLRFSAIQLKNILNSEYCSIYVLNNRTKRLEPIFFDRSHDAKAEKKCISILKLDSPASVCRSCAQDRVITHTRPFTLSREDVALDHICRTNTRTMLCTPILRRRAVLELINKGNNSGFNFLDEKYVKNFVRGMEPFLNK